MTPGQPKLVPGTTCGIDWTTHVELSGHYRITVTRRMQSFDDLIYNINN